MFVAQAHSFAAQARLAITLSWVAGYTNLLCLLIIAHPTSHISGTAALVGEFLVEPANHARLLPLVAILASFLVGAAVSGLLTEISRRRGWDSIYVLPVTVQTLLLVAVAVTIEMADRQSQQRGAAFWIIMLAAPAAMGLQNATITRISAGVVRTTHVTGVITDLGMESAQLLIHAWDHRRWGDHHTHHHNARHESPLSPRRLALLLSIFGSFIIGAALAALLFDNLPSAAVYPPVAFLLWIIYVDSTRPIAEIERVDDRSHVAPQQGLAIFHVRPDSRRRGRAHRLPNLLAWAARLDEQVRVVVLDLDHVAALDDNAALEVRALLDELRRRGIKLVLSGITPEQYRQLDRVGVVAHLDPLSLFPDFELAVARGVSLLPAP